MKQSPTESRLVEATIRYEVAKAVAMTAEHYAWTIAILGAVLLFVVLQDYTGSIIAVIIAVVAAAVGYRAITNPLYAEIERTWRVLDDLEQAE